MARSNTGSSSNRFSTATASVTAAPLTIACWFNPANLTSNQNLIFLDNSADTSYFGLIWDGANGNGQGDNVVLAVTQLAASGAEAFGISPSGGTANAWNHAAAVFASSTSRTAYLNGSGGTTNTTSKTPTSLTLTYIGSLFTFSPLNGSMAEVGIWNAALTAAEILSLSKGCSPLLVRPDNLIRYWPLMGVGTETCRISGQTLTVTGTMAKAAHVPILSPRLPILGMATAAGGAVNGTLAATIDPVTQSTNGDLLVQGSFAQTISAFTQTATGQLLVKGSLAGTIDPVTLSATGKLLVQGSLSGTIDPVTVSTNGDLLIQGSLAQTIPAVTQAATGQVVLNGSLAQTIAPVTLSANGSVVIQGSFGQTIDPVTLTASGSSASGGALNATIDPVTLSATGAVIIQGNFGQTIAPVTQASTGALTVKGTFGQTIDPVTLAASAGGIPDANNGALGQTIGPITLAANGSSPSQFRATSSGRGTSYAYKTLTELREEEKQKLAALQKRASKVVAKVISGPGILTADLAEIVQDAVEATPQYKSLAPDMVDFIAAAIEAKFRKAFERRLEEEDDEEAMLLAA